MTQTADLLSMLLSHPEGITPLDALEGVGSFRLAARVNDLRKEGHVIDSEMVQVGGKRVARYRLRIYRAEREGKPDQYVNVGRARAEVEAARRIAGAQEEDQRRRSTPRIASLRLVFGEVPCKRCGGTGGNLVEACYRCEGRGK